MQRSDYTFKFNKNLGRHGWLRLTPAYSVKLVSEMLETEMNSCRILDPFSGTATTPLVAAEAGFKAWGLDINPFLIWFGALKTMQFGCDILNDVKIKAQTCIEKSRTKDNDWVPPIFNIKRWWSAVTLDLLSALRASIVEFIGEPNTSANGLIWVAFLRLVVDTSSVAFNHVSMSFADHTKDYAADVIYAAFEDLIDNIIDSARKPLAGEGTVIKCDSKDVSGLSLQFDRIITSPPYPNRMSYIRELRPYMYWSKFLVAASEAGDLDWEAIGGTWGSATSKLNTWYASTDPSDPLNQIVKEITTTGQKNSGVMALYVHKFFHDMHLHLTSVQRVLSPNAKVTYIVGNSSFYGCVVDTPGLLEISLRALGFKDVSTRIIRRRNCNKSLFEYDVSATMP